VAPHLPEYSGRAEQKYNALRETMREAQRGGGEFELDPGTVRLAVARAFGTAENPRTGRFLLANGMSVRILEPVRTRWAKGEVELHERDGKILWRLVGAENRMGIDLAAPGVADHSAAVVLDQNQVAVAEETVQA
jgi:hypothetical protein